MGAACVRAFTLDWTKQDATLDSMDFPQTISLILKMHIKAHQNKVLCIQAISLYIFNTTKEGLMKLVK